MILFIILGLLLRLIIVAQQNPDIKLIRKIYISWLVGDGVDYNKPEVMQKYNKIRRKAGAILSLTNVSNSGVTNPGSVYDFNVIAGQYPFWVITEGKLLKLCMIYYMPGPVNSTNVGEYFVIHSDSQVKKISLINSF